MITLGTKHLVKWPSDQLLLCFEEPQKADVLSSHCESKFYPVYEGVKTRTCHGPKVV